MGKNLLKGKLTDLLKITTPAYVHSASTYISLLKHEIYNIEKFLLLAHEKGVLNNPLERIQLVTTAMLSSIHTGVLMNGIKSPLNPILGETTCETTENGSMLYTEQTSHHPPISHF